MATIVLTREEAKILDALRLAIRKCDLKTEVRVAGGWVRDKLLGVESHDLDIALDGMTGQQFCDRVLPCLRKTDPSCSYKVIKSNPERSKHLETTKLEILGGELDVVNLRSETYSNDSRIPTSMKFGTPSEDAYRRDLTINSLFYNVAADKVEDFTGRGAMDLKLGKIRTPLPPLVTFLDDPLRVLRSIRFAARFNFELDEELECVASADSVKAAFETKITRERISQEIQAMLFGKNPARAMCLLHKLGYWPLIFTRPVSAQSVKDFQVVCETLESVNIPEEGERRLVLVAGILYPFKKENDTVKALYKAIGNTFVQDWYELNKCTLSGGLPCLFNESFRVEAGLAFRDRDFSLSAAALFLSVPAPSVQQKDVFNAILKSISLSGKK
ncbi:CCA tRNA nucleotidyltransferase, mitochondrial [Selaginella moellendorffii]|uniref:CCA tRNA nucleotidyltransferase, mitochondrial n=1 Tax=Selaginella moellendorffii TaxID=88036 RepID=UPI000D1C4465|nr:CCA tRNA nucleotidyltransferase, mitochondrial [Selaginella moellendorffii]|eukprot:XP_024526540.1 CCA tRNA nucleotidyltransferase, mitochondrial [Selaginella moellendorffii]